MRDEVDRVAAAAGVAVVHACAPPPSRQAWTGASAVLLDAGRRRSLRGSRAAPARPLVLLSRGEPQAGDWQAAIAVGAQHVMTLPADEAELVAALSEAAESASRRRRRGAVVAVIGGRGGAGASLVRDCAGTDRAASRAARRCRPVERRHRPAGRQRGRPGIALARPGSAARAARSGRRCARRCRGATGSACCPASARGNDVEPGALAAVIDAGRRGGATVVCDLPRRLTRAVEVATGRGRPGRR